MACVAQMHTRAPSCVPGGGAPWAHYPPQTASHTCSEIPYRYQFLEQDPLLRKQSKPRYLGLLGAKAGEALSMGLSIRAALEEQYGKANGNSRVLRNSYALRDFDCPLFSAPLTGALPSSSGFLHGMYTPTSASTAWQPLSTLSYSPHLHEHVWQIPLLFGQHLKCFPSTIIRSVSCVIPTRAL